MYNQSPKNTKKLPNAIDIHQTMQELGKVNGRHDKNTDLYLLSCKAKKGWVRQITIGTTGIHAGGDQNRSWKQEEATCPADVH